MLLSIARLDPQLLQLAMRSRRDPNSSRTLEQVCQLHIENHLNDTLYALMAEADGLSCQPSGLLRAGLTTDLHNFAFLGKNPYLGAASDWVWFNVPHGPQKQIRSFISSLKACRAGKEQVRLSLYFIGCSCTPWVGMCLLCNQALVQEYLLQSVSKIIYVQEVAAALLATPFGGCKGEPLNSTRASGMKVRIWSRVLSMQLSHSKLVSQSFQVIEQ